MACNVTLLPSIKQGYQEKDLPIVIPQKNLVFPIVLPLKFLSTVFSVCPGVIKTYWIIFPDITTLHLTKNQGCINYLLPRFADTKAILPSNLSVHLAGLNCTRKSNFTLQCETKSALEL